MPDFCIADGIVCSSFFGSRAFEKYGAHNEPLYKIHECLGTSQPKASNVLGPFYHQLQSASVWSFRNYLTRVYLTLKS